MDIAWQTQTFEQLSSIELFDILKLRQAVFVVEQKCPYPDIDATDKVALHLSGWIQDQIAAYARIIKPGITYEQASIGRIVVAEYYRGTGLGVTLVERAISVTESSFPDFPIKIGAQQALENFYESLGFKTVSEVYLEDGIPHIDMLRD